ncbi:hypothetical protein G6F57_020034 [Rhizopus arrhizus]|nr:hypothetical protein G6F57_020034 [Rhizopus arrhizus]
MRKRFNKAQEEREPRGSRCSWCCQAFNAKNGKCLSAADASASPAKAGLHANGRSRRNTSDSISTCGRSACRSVPAAWATRVRTGPTTPSACGRNRRRSCASLR